MQLTIRPGDKPGTIAPERPKQVEAGVQVDGNRTLTASRPPSIRRAGHRVALSRAALLIVALSLAACGASNAGGTAGGAVPTAHPQVLEPAAGVQQQASVTPPGSYGDPNAHATPLSAVRRDLSLEIVAEKTTDATYIDPLRYVTVWERTDQGVDAVMPVGAPILAPGPVKVLAVIPDWYAGQPLVYFELLNGQYAGQVQYVAEQITGITRPGTFLQQGQSIAHFAKSGTGIEYGWSTQSGITMAVATTGYEEGEVTPAGRNMREWLNSLGANAGSS